MLLRVKDKRMQSSVVGGDSDSDSESESEGEERVDVLSFIILTLEGPHQTSQPPRFASASEMGIVQATLNHQDYLRHVLQVLEMLERRCFSQ